MSTALFQQITLILLAFQKKVLFYILVIKKTNQPPNSPYLYCDQLSVSAVTKVDGQPLMSHCVNGSLLKQRPLCTASGLAMPRTTPLSP